jgi:hypothetical protein
MYLPNHHLTAVASDFGPAALQQFDGRHSVSAEKTVYTLGRCIAGRLRIDHYD